MVVLDQREGEHLEEDRRDRVRHRGELVEEGPHGIVPDASHASIDSENDSLHKASSSDADMPSTEGDAESSFDIDLVDVPACIEKTNKYTSVRSHTF